MVARKGDVKKTEGHGYRKLSGPAGDGTAGPGQHIRISLMKSSSAHQGPMMVVWKGHVKETGGHGYKKLSRWGFRDFLGNGYT